MPVLGIPADTAAERAALVESIFAAFRERGEASDDVAEGAETALELLRSGDQVALDALLAYAAQSPGLLREVEKRHALETA
ncbi:MAG TPA: hypothetical protein VIG46_08275 [Candidatus Baltobacteraceae bacterium]|jgi:hypothetical protein